MVETAITLEPGLYVTATPIGNLADITYRAVTALRSADLILCEDTRQTAKLCAAYGIDTPRKPYHEHNGERARPGIITKLQEGAAICLVSDAGTPLISDPGYKLVREARDAGINIVPLPGANAAISALCASGAPSGQFLFAGFLPVKAGARTKYLESFSQTDATLIFYETPPRLAASLASMGQVFGNRQAMVARELTKMFEEFREGCLSDLSSYYERNPTKGEIVVLVHPPIKTETTAQELDEFLHDALANMSVKEAAAEAAQILGVQKREAYNRALKLKNQP